jgi:hypothetical protein
VSASSGSFRVIPLLLQTGPSSQVPSIPAKKKSMCGEMAGRQLTPSDLVRAHLSTGGIKRFEEELRKIGMETNYKDGDIFWPVL